MKLRHIAVLSLTALVILSGATAAMATQGGSSLSLASGSQHSSLDDAERDGTVNVTVDGDVAPGNEVALTATHDDQPVRFASVSVNGQYVGETDANGSITVTVPDADEFEVEVEAESEGEQSVPLDDETDTDGDDREDDESDEADEDDRLNVTLEGDVTPGSSVTIVATHDGYPVAGASVTVNGEQVGETDANGTVTTTVPDGDEFDVEVELEEEGKLKVPLEEESVDDEKDEAEDTEKDEEGQLDLIVEGTLEPGETLSITAMHDGTSVTNATVTVNGDTVGETDENGSIAVQVPNSDELEIEVAADDLEAEMTVDFEDAEDGDHDNDDDDAETEDDDAKGDDDGDDEDES